MIVSSPSVRADVLGIDRPSKLIAETRARAHARVRKSIGKRTHMRLAATHATRRVYVDWNAKLQQYNTRALLRDCHEQLSVRSNTRAGRAHKITRALSKKPDPRRARVGFRLADWGRERAFAGTSFTPTIAHTSAERLPGSGDGPRSERPKLRLCCSRCFYCAACSR